MSVSTAVLGFPRIGAQRQLKKTLEAYWGGKATAEELQQTAATLRQSHWQNMKEAGITFVPSNDFSFYDHVLDTAVTLGVVPARYKQIQDPIKRFFAMARGRQDAANGVDIPALEMTKWFDTNYHYIVPELAPDQAFAYDAKKIVDEYTEARKLGIETRPVILGPVSFLLLAKVANTEHTKVAPLDLLPKLLPVYTEMLKSLKDLGVSWIQLDEPCLVLELDEKAKAAYRSTLQQIADLSARPNIALTTYFGPLAENLQLVPNNAFEALHLDLVRAPEQLAPVLAWIGAKTKLSVGVVDGRNIWRNDVDASLALVNQATKALGADRVIVASSCSLLHSPVDLTIEDKLDKNLLTWLAFAKQKIEEIGVLAVASTQKEPNAPAFLAARAAIQNRRDSVLTKNAAVRERMKAVTTKMHDRAGAFSARAEVQRNRFKLPAFPTTTIGSFPQTADVRSIRADWRAGKVDQEAYNRYLQTEIKDCVKRQEDLDIDVLVHGEFERTDMVEHFGEKLEGFAFTKNGWVQSYGSRCVKPPVLFGDVYRRYPMTVSWSKYAQSLTNRPMKGMLTGPVTILQWSFVRNDQPRSDTCQQIALAIRDEVNDLEAAGIPMIQVDEPALREGLPLRKRDWEAYLKWSVDAFKLSTSGVENKTQIHTHMCYSEFGDILPAVARLDANVLSIETSRSHMELLGDFGKFSYPNEVGPGVYDIHSPRVPSVSEMTDLLAKALKVLPAELIWVNPDCGLKTRGWEEVTTALSNMVSAAKIMRKRIEA